MLTLSPSNLCIIFSDLSSKIFVAILGICYNNKPSKWVGLRPSARQLVVGPSSGEERKRRVVTWTRMTLVMQEAGHLVPNWWCCLGFMWRPPSRERPSLGVECESKSHTTVSLFCLLSAYDSRGEFAACCFCCHVAIRCDAVDSDSLGP